MTINIKDYSKNINSDGGIDHLGIWHRGIMQIVNVKNKNILDIGCGSGSLLKTFLPEARSVLGIDPNPQNITKLNEQQIPGKVGFLEDFKNELLNSFDTAFCCEVIEHLYDYKILFANTSDVLKDGGKFVVSTPNAFNILRGLDFLFLQKHRDILMDPTQSPDPEHVRLWSYDMLKRAFEKTGFKNVRGYGALRVYSKDILLKNKFFIKYFAQNLIFVGIKQKTTD